MTSFILAGQVSTSHSSPQALSVSAVREKLRRAQQVMPFPVLITGARELPEIFHELIDSATRTAEEVYIWYNLLSGYPGQSEGERVINYQGEPCTGWGGWEIGGDIEVDETFVFSCPNNPDVRRKTLAGLEHFLKNYSFEGVFLDKFRFPSPANGLEMVYSCFCPYCQEKAKSQGLDLEQVRGVLNGELRPPRRSGEEEISWLNALARENPLLGQFLRFRCQSIYDLVAEVRALADQLGRKVALDLFTPLLAPLVGQDYAALFTLGDWFKPMTYRRAYGPAGFRLEVESLVDGIGRMYNIPIDVVLETALPFYPEVSPANYQHMVESTAQMEWMRYEINQAVQLLSPKPVLMGLETVNFPGVIEILPSMVREMVTAGLQLNIHGAVISWDLLNTPLENIQAIRDSL